MELLNSFLGQGVIAQIGEIVLFNKKIKTRFPILFKRALEFHLMKASGRIGYVCVSSYKNV